MTQNSLNPISPVAQFSLLLAPVVMSCFFLVYALTGLIVDGRDKLLWSIEALDVAFYTGAGIVAYSIVVMLYARWKGATRYHVLNISSIGHIVLSIVLVICVFVTVKM